MTDVIRPKTSYSEEQRQALAAAVAKAQAAERAEDEAWEAINAARRLGVLDTDLTGEQTPARFNRATLNRRYGPRQG